jgi:hypothetical protein
MRREDRKCQLELNETKGGEEGKLQTVKNNGVRMAK